MITLKKALVTAGLLAAAALAVPGVASAATPTMYQTCSASQEGHRITTAAGDTLECIATDAGYDWEKPITS